MDSLLPRELISSSIESISCREAQIRQLVNLLDSRFPSPSTVVVHGVEATGKSLTLKTVLSSTDVPHAVVPSQECITTRHLLERAIFACKDAVEQDNTRGSAPSIDGRCESISAFVVQLQRLLGEHGKFILVFDGIDQQREAAPTLLPAIARLGEIIPVLTVILVVTAPRARFLHLPGVPHIHFPPYTRAESLSIVSSSPLPITDPSSTDGQDPSAAALRSAASDADSAWLWTRFCSAVWDSLGQAAARDIVNFRAACERLWKPFIQPVIQGHYAPREFSKLMVKNRPLFQSEAALKESIIPFHPNSSAISKHKRPPHLRFPHHTAHLLLAAYLASHTPPRNDTLLFSKSSHLRSRHRRRPYPASARRRKPARHLLGPQPFPLERLGAVFRAISPSEPVGGDLMAQIAVLAGLRLLVRAGAAADEGAGGKWRVGFGWEFTSAVARGVGFDLEAYIAE